MNIVFGLKAHSGWAALIVLGLRDGDPQVVDRRRIELVEPGEASWAKQPFHAAEHLPAAEARNLVEKGIAAAERNAAREIQMAIERAGQAGHEVVGCAILVGDPMPDWTIAEILAVHVRMHRAEGVLFRQALAQAATASGLSVLRIPEKELEAYAASKLAASANRLRTTIAVLGKSVGPPWGKDQKDAALAALIALRVQKT